MARRRGRHGGRRTKRARSAKRRYRGSALHRYNLARKRRKHGGHRRRRRQGRRHGGVSKSKYYQRLIARGVPAAKARKIAARAERMRASHIHRHFTKEATTQAREQALANLFAGIAGAGRAAKAGL